MEGVPDNFVLDGEEIAPRSEAERYRIYRVKDGGRPELVATCRTQGSIGVALCRLGKEGMFLDYCLGIMDGRDHRDDSGQWIGRWLLLPWFSKEAVAQLKGRTR